MSTLIDVLEILHDRSDLTVILENVVVKDDAGGASTTGADAVADPLTMLMGQYKSVAIRWQIPRNESQLGIGRAGCRVLSRAFALSASDVDEVVNGFNGRSSILDFYDGPDGSADDFDLGLLEELHLYRR